MPRHPDHLNTSITPLVVAAPASADIRALRERHGLTQVQLAALAGVHPNTLARAERGEKPLDAAHWALALLSLDEHPRAVLAAARRSKSSPVIGPQAVFPPRG